MRAHRGDRNGRVPSGRWRGWAVAALVGGPLVTIALVIATLQIDGTATAAHMSITQDAIGVVTVGIGLVGLTLSVGCGYRWWSRPAVLAGPSGVTVFNRRQIALPWHMVNDVTVIAPPGKRTVAALMLVNGNVVPLRFAPDPQPIPYGGGWTSPVDDFLRASIDFYDAARAQHRPLASPAILETQPGTMAITLVRDLPEPPLVNVRLKTSPLLLLIFVIAPIAATRNLLAAQSGHPFDVVQFLLAIAAIEVAVAVIGACYWSRRFRRVAVSATWIAWRPRLERRWRLIHFADLVSASKVGERHDALALQISDGRGITLLRQELPRVVAISVFNALNHNPAMSSAARALLHKVIGASPATHS